MADQRRLVGPSAQRQRARTARRRRPELEADAQPQLGPGEAADSAGGGAIGGSVTPPGPDAVAHASAAPGWGPGGGRRPRPEELPQADAGDLDGDPAGGTSPSFGKRSEWALNPSFTRHSPCPSTQPVHRGNVSVDRGSQSHALERKASVLDRALPELSSPNATAATARDDVSCLLAPRVGSNGYGLGTGRESAHRRAYREAHGPIPAGAEIHHSCHTKACIEPSHLVALDRIEHLKAHVWPALERWRASNGPQDQSTDEGAPQ